MGDPKKQKKKFSGPFKLWDKERIDEEKDLIKEYHFKNKQEIWKWTAKLRNFTRQAKRLIPLKTEQAEKEKLQLLTKLRLLGLLSETGDLDDVLGITLKDLLERRLQTLVFKQGFARSMKQSRQFIVHEHILIGGRKMTSPNYVVPKSDESSISFSMGSALHDEMHPERIQEEKLAKKPSKEEKSAKKTKDSDKEEAKEKVSKKESKEKSSKEEKPKKKAKKAEKKEEAKEENPKKEKSSEDKKEKKGAEE